MVATFIGNGLQSASVGCLWSYVNSEFNRKAVGENCLGRHRWQFLTSDPRFKE